MKKAKFYRQCRLQKTVEGRVSEEVSYIPEPYCVVGRILKLKAKDGTWEDGWEVVSASERRPAKAVEEEERGYLKTRGVSDC
jgi:hypothetical protein